MFTARLNYAESHSARDQDEKVFALASSLAYQHGGEAEQFLDTAHRIVSNAFARGDDLSGTRAPVIAHDHGGHWSIWRMNDRELKHVVLDGEAALEHAHTLADRLNVPCFVFGRDGRLVEKQKAVTYHVEREPPALDRLVDVPVPSQPSPSLLPTNGPLKVGRHDEQWAVYAGEMVVATSRTRDGARKLAKTMSGSNAIT